MTYSSETPSPCIWIHSTVRPFQAAHKLYRGGKCIRLCGSLCRAKVFEVWLRSPAPPSPSCSVMLQKSCLVLEYMCHWSLQTLTATFSLARCRSTYLALQERAPRPPFAMALLFPVDQISRKPSELMSTLNLCSHCYQGSCQKQIGRSCLIHQCARLPCRRGRTN